MPNTSEFKLSVGTKAQVYHGTAGRTAGGLKKNDLMKTAKGRIVSKKAHAAGLVAIKRLRNALKNRTTNNRVICDLTLLLKPIFLDLHLNLLSLLFYQIHR